MWTLLASVIVLACVSAQQELNTNDNTFSNTSDETVQTFSQDSIYFLATDVESAALRLVKAFSKKDLAIYETNELSSTDKFLTCTTCRAVVNVLIRTFKENESPENDEILKNISIDICERLQLQTREVCSGLIDLNMPSIKYIIQNTKVDARTFCSVFMELHFCNVEDINYNWNLTIDGTDAAVTAPKSDIPMKNGNELHILHLTDIHYDPLYEPGALAECAEPQCCLRGAGFTESEKAAGYWGDYRKCDAPWHMIENALNHIKKTHTNIDYIYQTGDLVHHMVWNTSVENNIDMLTKVNKRLAEVFPGVSIFPCIGNHESHPVNLFSADNVPEELSTQWLFENLYEQWSIWLPNDTRKTILKGGYYTVSPKPGFRIIALNNNDCLSENWWLYYEGTNKIPQLQWLYDTLLVAENVGEYVHILAHIPTGDETCWSVWAREFSRLVLRFRNIISGIFNGHTHYDEMNLYYSDDGHAIGIAWNGGSLTTFSNKNPNYRIYHAETESMQIVDHETWIFNLTEANVRGKYHTPNWFREYLFSNEFTENLSPAGIDKLLNKMADNPEILRKYWKFKMTTADPMITKGCGRACLLNTICRIATTVNNQKSRCKELKKRLSLALDNESTTLDYTTGTTDLPTSFSTESTTEENKVNGVASLSFSVKNLAVLIFSIYTFTYYYLR